jgi:hypothetical protein
MLKLKSCFDQAASRVFFGGFFGDVWRLNQRGRNQQLSQQPLAQLTSSSSPEDQRSKHRDSELHPHWWFCLEELGLSTTETGFITILFSQQQSLVPTTGSFN